MNSSHSKTLQPNNFFLFLRTVALILPISLLFLSSCVVYDSSLRSRGNTPVYQSQQPYSPNNQGYGSQGSSQSYPSDGYNSQGYPSQPPPTQTFSGGQNGMNQSGNDLDWQRSMNRPITFQMFYDELYPYGEWLNLPEHGYVWRPYNVDANWQPYLTNGRWVYTRYGWTWVSNYQWGWAPFHYGRWKLDTFYGWYWVPGNVWGPAWVEWRQYDGNYWWIPLPPNIGPGGNFAFMPRAWNVVPARYFTDPYCQNYALRYSQYSRYLNSTTIINNTYIYNNVTYPAGPSADDVSRYTGGKVIPYALRNLNQASASTVSDKNVSIYAPSVQPFDQTNDGGKMRPVNFTPAARAVQGKAGIYNETQNEEQRGVQTAPSGNPSQPPVITDGKSRPVAMPTPVETPSNGGSTVGPFGSTGKKGSVQMQEQQTPGNSQGNPSGDDGRIPRYTKPRPVGIPETAPTQPAQEPFPTTQKKSNPFEQPRQEPQRQEQPRYEAPKYEAPQPSTERKSSPFGQPRQEQPRYEAPKYEAPQPSTERKSSPFEQPRQEQPRYERSTPQPSTERKSSPFEQPRQEQPRHEAPKHESPKQSPPPSSTTPQPYTGKKGGGD